MIKIGSICRCRKGITGIVQRAETRHQLSQTGVKLGSVKITYHGTALDTDRAGMPWQSKQPVHITDSLDEWVVLRYNELKAKLA